MARKPRSIDRTRLRTVSARGRRSKLRTRDEATPHQPGDSLETFLAGLPSVLGAEELRAAVAPWLGSWEIHDLLERRRQMVDKFRIQIAGQGELNAFF